MRLKESKSNCKIKKFSLSIRKKNSTSKSTSSKRISTRLKRSKLSSKSFKLRKSPYKSQFKEAIAQFSNMKTHYKTCRTMSRVNSDNKTLKKHSLNILPKNPRSKRFLHKIMKGRRPFQPFLKTLKYWQSK
jgi:hypothetical protein